MDTNRWFFWIDRLHISASERYFVSALLIIYVLLWAVEPLLSFKGSFDETYYAPLMEAFAEHTADRYEAKIALLEQYYPGQTDTIQVIAAQIIPPGFVPVVMEVLQRRSGTLAAQQSEIDDDQYDVPVHIVGAGDGAFGLDEVYSSSGTDGYAATSASNLIDSSQPDRADMININTAGTSELVKLPGIGPSIAERIINHRSEHGAFQRIEDIMNVRGIGRTRFDQIKHLLTV
jgi:comEA protein